MRQAQTATLGVALLLSLLALQQPTLSWPRELHRWVLIFDITQSMNVADLHVEGAPPTRLEYARAAARRAVQALPCGSEVGLGLYTTSSVQLLFTPIEVCEHLPVIDAVLDHIDWRMAWSADSHIAQGVFSAIRDLSARDTSVRLAFLTDGQETPPPSFKATFTETPGKIKGLLAGVGGLTPVPVPRFDRENHPLGVWENADIETPPVSTTDYSEKFEVQTLPREGPYLSWLDQSNLRSLSIETGLRYQRLDRLDSLAEALQRAEFAERRAAPLDARPLLGIAALVLLAFSYLMDRRA